LHIFIFGLVTAMTAAGIWSTQARAQGHVFDTKDPVFGAGCPVCTLNASGTFVREALKLDGKDIRLCETCVGPKGSLYNSEHRLPPPARGNNLNGSEVPTDPVDFGATSSLIRTQWAFKGLYSMRVGGPLGSMGAHPHMRAIALIEAPIYIVAAVHAESDIQSLDDLKLRKGLKIGIALEAEEPSIQQEMLDYYGLTADVLKANGDTIVRENDESADILISDNAAFNASVENRFWPAITAKTKLRFLPLADPLRTKLANDFFLRPGIMPRSFFPGVDKPVPTVVRIGHLIYGSDDMPEQYAYDVAKALDRHKDLLQFMFIQMSYNKETVTQSGVIPLHPGAARYYREVGYLK
jgi:TRAP transporter TAXI family solute receptor